MQAYSFLGRKQPKVGSAYILSASKTVSSTYLEPYRAWVACTSKELLQRSVDEWRWIWELWYRALKVTFFPREFGKNTITGRGAHVICIYIYIYLSIYLFTSLYLSM